VFPKENSVRESFRRALTWKELKGPISVTFACAFGMAIALVDRNIFNDDSPFDLKAASVLSAMLLVMDMGSAERFYLSTTYRMLGTLAGMGWGIILAVAEYAVIAAYKADSKPHGGDWRLVVYRVSVVVPTILFSAIAAKRWSKMAYPIVVFAVQTPSILFKKDMADAVSSIVSTVLALSFAAFSIVVFDNMSTDSIIAESNYKAVDGVLSVMELAVKADHSKADDFARYSEQVHKFITQAESAVQTYADWHRVTCRKPPKDYSQISKPLKALFYQAYALYWSHAESFNATTYDAAILFCESEDVYRRHFKASVEDVILGTRAVKQTLESFLLKFYRTSDETFAVFITIVDTCMWDHLYVAQDRIRATYLEKRSECFPSFSQRWNMTHYMRQICLMSLALLEYIKALACVFLEDADKQAIVLRHIEELSDALDDMRKNELVFIRSRSISKTTASEIGSSPAASFMDASPLSSILLPRIVETEPVVESPRADSATPPPRSSSPLQRRLSDPVAGERGGLLSRSQTRGGL
jgi:hypothetical protein